jgi:hypothetical protein
MAFAALVVLGYLLGSCPWGYWLVRLVKHEDIRTVGSGNIGATNVGGSRAHLGAPVVLLDVERLRAGRRNAVRAAASPVGITAGAAAILVTGGRSSCASPRAARLSRPVAASSSASPAGRAGGRCRLAGVRDRRYASLA